MTHAPLLCAHYAVALALNVVTNKLPNAQG